MLRKAKVCVPKRPLIGRLGGEAGLDPAGESRKRSQRSCWTGSPFPPVLTVYSGEGESFAERKDDG
jgi:hypothetical protein